MNQNLLLKAMKRPETYDESVEDIRIVQTHISWVFLTGKFAYKIKKPVNFGFLDFTTLEKRKYFCEREVEINRRFSPEIYLGVLPLAEKAGNIKLGGEGKVLEYVVKMREIPQECLMSEKLERGEVCKRDMEKIADILLRFYEKTERGRRIERFGSPEMIWFNWEENFRQTRGFLGKTIDEKSFRMVKQYVEGFLERNRKLFLDRIKEGKVLWCHGDLHSGNIFLEDGKVWIFDAIEFNERFACSDVASDIAFLVMDVEFRGKKTLSDYFVKKYLEKSGDSGLEKLLDFYKCYRAYVRGKVTSFRLMEKGISEEEREKAISLARRYFEYCSKIAESSC